ncbi:MAG: amidohydrolase family protein [Chloroflexi bacterium]|nr:amidohydrolase family protein [Chloroflexota bacterium]
MVTDFHTHYLAREHFDLHARTPEGRLVGASLGGGGDILQANGFPLGTAASADDFCDLDRRLRAMSEGGVDIQVLSPPPFMVFTEIAGAESARLAREQNDAIAQVVRRYPDSFRGIGVAPFHDAEHGVPEIAYLMDTLGLAGVEILTQMAGRNLDDPSFEPIWQALDERNALVLLHPNDVLGGDRLARYYLRNLLGNPVETAIALASLMFGGVLDRYPHIRFLAAHGGGVVPFVIGRWEHAARVRPELQHLTSSPLELLRRVYVDTIVHGPQELTYLVDLLGPERIVAGSDFPFDMGTREPAALFGASLSEDARERILSGHQDLVDVSDRSPGT